LNNDDRFAADKSDNERFKAGNQSYRTIRTQLDKEITYDNHIQASMPVANKSTPKQREPAPKKGEDKDAGVETEEATVMEGNVWTARSTARSEQNASGDTSQED
jgi:hypothetical protein